MWKVTDYFNTNLVCIVDEDNKVISAPLISTEKLKLQCVVDLYNELMAQQNIPHGENTTDLFTKRNHKT